MAERGTESGRDRPLDIHRVEDVPSDAEDAAGVRRSTLPWMYAPTAGIVTVMMEFATVVKLSVRTFDTRARSLGRLAHQAEVAADVELGAVLER